MKVGMYCYNKTNRKLGIGKIDWFEDNNNVCIRYKNAIQIVSVGNIVASFDIFDLIKVGDIITTNNLCGEVTKIVEHKREIIDKENNQIYTTCYDGESCNIRDIKSIVIKEQFEETKYEIGGIE